MPDGRPTQKRPRNPAYWTEEEDAKLRALAAVAMLAEQIAWRLGRTPNAIKGRAKVLEIKLVGLVEWLARRGIRPYG